MEQRIKLANFQFHGLTAVIVTILLLLGGVGYNMYRRSTLHAQGLEQVKEYLEMELPSRVVREQGARKLTAKKLANLKQFEIVEFSSRLVPANKTRVRVRIKLPDEELTFYFRFRRSLGKWTLQGEGSSLGGRY